MNRNLNGTFSRQHNVWDGTNWNDGYENKGRFMVYRPDYPRAYKEGYALRAHVVWWLKTGKIHPKGKELHHKDQNKINDVFNNLTLLTKKQHDSLHAEERQKRVTLICDNCGMSFTQKQSRASRYSAHFCSRACNCKHFWKVRRYA